MIRFRNKLGKLNLKYVIGEIILIFVGISLAIWFNNWNTSIQSNQDKEIVIKRVKEEIKSNLEGLAEPREVNQNAIDGFREYSKYYGANSNEIISTPSQFNTLQTEYPGFFRVNDSIALDKNRFKYRGETYLYLELVELTEIAWKTAQSLNVANEFSYDCLYQLESMYNLQTKVVNGFDKVANSLGDNKDIKQIIRWLKIVLQLELQLEQDYHNMLENIEQCR